MTQPAGRLIVAAALLGLLSGCTANGDIDNTTAPVILVVSNIRAISDPFGDVLSSSGSIPEDVVQVDFVARLKNSGDITTPTLQEIIVNRYEVTYTRTDGGTAVPAGFQRAMNAKVRITAHGQTTERITQVDLVVVPSPIKSQPPLSQLIVPGVESGTGYINIQATATIRFFGTTVAGDPVSATAAIGIDFANFADGS